MKTLQIEGTPMQLKQINAFAEQIGAKIVKSVSKKTTSKKETHPYLLETEEHHKRLKNEIIRKYNERASVKDKIEPIL